MMGGEGNDGGRRGEGRRERVKKGALEDEGKENRERIEYEKED